MKASRLIILLALVAVPGLIRAENIKIEPLLAALKAVGPKGAGHKEAIAAWQKLKTADAEQLPEVLAGMDGAGELAANWIRSSAETIAQRHAASGGKLPLAALEKFLGDTKHAPRARRLAYEIIALQDATAEKRLIPTQLNDPSLELRRDAVAQVLDEAEALLKDEKKDAAALAYRKAFAASRDLDQIKKSAEALGKLEQKVDLPLHFGFIMKWKLVGPFDNTDKKGFDVAYEPEKAMIDLKAEYAGKLGKVSWIDFETTDAHGVVDLTKALDKHKGAITYAYAEFLADRDRPADLRLGCINANKIWLNGELVSSNEVYHANTSIDQYIAKGRLKKGKNIILLKVCQNEQTEAWAQDWKFQLRVCDEIGTPILSQDRPISQTASR